MRTSWPERTWRTAIPMPYFSHWVGLLGISPIPSESDFSSRLAALRDAGPQKAAAAEARSRILSKALSAGVGKGWLALPTLRKSGESTTAPHCPAKPTGRRCRGKPHHPVRHLSPTCTFRESIDPDETVPASWRFSGLSSLNCGRRSLFQSCKHMVPNNLKRNHFIRFPVAKSKPEKMIRRPKSP